MRRLDLPGAACESVFFVFFFPSPTSTVDQNGVSLSTVLNCNLPEGKEWSTLVCPLGRALLS